MRAYKKLYRAAILVAVTVTAFAIGIDQMSDGGADAEGFGSSKPVEGASCTRCSCKCFVGHKNKAGNFYGKCLRCKHTPQDHKLR